MISEEMRQTLEFGFFNELHHDPYCVEVEIHDLEGYRNITLVLNSYALCDEHSIDRIYRTTIRKFKEEYGIGKDRLVLENRKRNELTLVYKISRKKLLELYGLFKLKGIGNGLCWSW